MERLGKYIFEYSKKNKELKDIPVYSVTNSQGFCRDYFGKEVASKDKSTYKIVPKGYFAYNPSRINVGSVDWQRNEDEVIVSPLYNVFGVKETLDNQYLYYFLKSERALRRIKHVATGSVRDNLKFNMLCDFELNIGSIKEQKTIVEKLDLINDVINLKKEELDKLDELVKSRFIELFGDPILNNKNLQIFKINDIGQCIAGATPSTKVKEYWEGGTIPWMSSGEVNKGRVYETDTAITQSGYDNASTKLVPAHTVVIAMAGQGKTRGMSAITEIELCTNQSLCSIVNNEKINPEYLLQYLRMQYQELRNSSTCVEGRGGLNLKIIGNFPVMLPDIELQNQFAEFFEKVDKSKSIIQESLRKIQELYLSLMDKYFG